MQDEPFILPEIDQLVKVVEKTVYSMADKGQPQVTKVGGQWRFNCVDLDQRIEQREAATHVDGEPE